MDWPAIINSIKNVAIIVLTFIWVHLKYWLFIFLAPIKNPEILWILIPIWINWVFTELFQEKKGTGMGNAITNGAVMLWVGIDWIRYLLRIINESEAGFSWTLFGKFGACALVIFYGFFIIIYGMKGKEYIKILGRVRDTTYVLLMLSPIIYGIVEISLQFVVSVIIFFPVWYFVIEFLDRVTPNLIKAEDSNDFGSSSDPFKDLKNNDDDPFGSSSTFDSKNDDFSFDSNSDDSDPFGSSSSSSDNPFESSSKSDNLFSTPNNPFDDKFDANPTPKPSNNQPRHQSMPPNPTQGHYQQNHMHNQHMNHPPANHPNQSNHNQQPINPRQQYYQRQQQSQTRNSNHQTSQQRPRKSRSEFNF